MTATKSFDVRAVARLLAVVAALATAIALLPLSGAHAFHGEGTVDDVETARFDGENRYDTARLIAERTFGETDTVIVARADLFPDTLAANYLAGQIGAPILLVFPTSLVPQTQQALEDLNAENVIIVGGDAAVSPAVAAQLAQDYDVDRIHGVHRWATAAEIATSDYNEQGVGQWDGQNTAIVASGWNFPDALVAGAASYAENFPLLLTPQNELIEDTADVLEELDIERVIIPGGNAAVSAEVEAAIEAMEIDVTRVSGPFRVDTSINFAEFLTDEFGWETRHTNVAWQGDFPDALVMGPHAGAERSALVLSPGELAEYQAQHAGATASDNPRARSLDTWLRDHACEIVSIHIAGGTLRITEATEGAIQAAASDCELERGLRLSPSDAVNAFGEEHFVLAQVGGFHAQFLLEGEEDAEVRFEVYRNTTPADDDALYTLVETNDGDENTTTDEDGHVSFTYDYDGDVIGETNDIIVACVLTDEDGTFEDGDFDETTPVCAEVAEDEADDTLFTSVEARDDAYADQADKAWVERADVTVAIDDPDTGEAGSDVQATLSGADVEDLQFVEVEGFDEDGEQCVAHVVFSEDGDDDADDHNAWTESGADIVVEFNIDDDASEGACTITFTLWFDGRPNQTEQDVFTVTA